MEEINDNEELTVYDDHIAMALDSAQTSINEIEESFEAFKRLSETYSVLVIESGKDSFESTAKPLLEMALAGTDLELVDVSTESALDVIKSIGKAIIEAIRKIFNAIIDAVNNFDLVATWMLRTIKLLERKRLTSRGKVPNTPRVKLGPQHRFLRVGRIFADEPVRLETELKNLHRMIKVISSEYVSGLERGVARLTSISKDKTGDDLTKALIDAVEAVGFSSIGNHLKASTTDRDRWGRNGVKATPPYIGGKSLFLFDGDLGSKGTKGLRFHGFVHGDTYRTPFPVEDGREFTTLTPSDLSDIPNVLREIVETISNSGSARVTTSMKRLRDTLESYVNSRMNNAEMKEDDMRKIRETVNAFTHWSKNVISPIYGNSIQVVRAVLMYAQESTKTYH